MEGSHFYLYSPATLKKYQSCFELEAIQPDSLSGISGVTEIERESETERKKKEGWKGRRRETKREEKEGWGEGEKTRIKRDKD